MWPRVPRERMRAGPENEARLEAIAAGGVVPGLLAYADNVPAGWCSVGPRDHDGRFVDMAGAARMVKDVERGA
jgi:hypothetical protein